MPKCRKPDNPNWKQKKRHDENEQEVPFATIAPYLKKDSKNKRQEVDCPVLWRTIAFEHVEAVVYGGKLYEF
jgi:hypothetical protein